MMGKMSAKGKSRKGIIGLAMVVMMITSIFAMVAPTAIAQPPKPTNTLRIYGEGGLGPQTGAGRYFPVYTRYQQPFDPGVIQKDSVTFNPAILLDEEYGNKLSAYHKGNPTDIDVKKTLRMWYEPSHKYDGPRNNPEYYPTIMLESTYMLIDSKHKNPISGGVESYPDKTTKFLFPLAEIPAQPGLGTFDADGDGEDDIIELVNVTNTSVSPWAGTTQGEIAIGKIFHLRVGDGTQVRFLDHGFKLKDVVVSPENSDKKFAKIEISYLGNVEDDATTEHIVGVMSGTPSQRYYIDRANNLATTPQHPDRTSFIQVISVDYLENDLSNRTADILIGKILKAGDTFYVNGVRYDIAAVYTIDQDGDGETDEFKYITLRTPLPKCFATGVSPVRDMSTVSTQWIVCIPPNEPIPVNPPFNRIHDIIDDINVDICVDDGLQVSPEECTIGLIDEDGDGVPRLYDVDERIIYNVDPLEFYYTDETREPRYDTNLLEVYNQTDGEVWEYLNIHTMPDLYTEFVLPAIPDIDERYKGDYLVTTSFIANNTVDPRHIYDSVTGLPRVVFVYDQEDIVKHNGGIDIYVNYLSNDPLPKVRIYGEGDISGPVRARGDYFAVYDDPQGPFDPAAIRKDSITFNPAIILDEDVNHRMSAGGIDIDIKKYLRLWFEPEHEYDGPLENPHYYQTIEIETTYVPIDSKHKMPIGCPAGSTRFLFPLAEYPINDTPSPSEIGLGTFDADGDGVDDLVNLAYVSSGTTTRGTIRIEQVFHLEKGTTIVRFLDHGFKFDHIGVNPDNPNEYGAWVIPYYLGNARDEEKSPIFLNTTTVYLDRDCNKAYAPLHPNQTSYIRLLSYSPDHNSIDVLIGKEISAGDTFYVNSKRYDVAAVYVHDGLFKYITLRSPLPEREGDQSDEQLRDFSVVTSQFITTIPPCNPIPLDPPFNREHLIVDDIDIPKNRMVYCMPPLYPHVADRIIGPYPPLEFCWWHKEPERRYHTNLLEILNENYTGTAQTVENWTFFEPHTMPDEYKEFVLPQDPIYGPDDPLHNDYLITTSWHAPNCAHLESPDHHDLIDVNYRVAFVYNVWNYDGLYINEIVPSPPPFPTNIPPTCNISLNATRVQALQWIRADGTGSSDPDGTTLSYAWDLDNDGIIDVDASSSTSGTMSSGYGVYNKVTPDASIVDFYYNLAGTYNVTLIVKDSGSPPESDICNKSVTVLTSGYIFKLKKGWNMVAMPVMPANTSVDSVFWPGVAIYKWNATIGRYEVPFNVAPYEGYWVWAPEDKTISVIGNKITATQADLNLVPGWNLVGTGFNELKIDYWATTWLPEKNRYSDWTHTLEPGKGYWVWR